ncbi:hypothetical protein ABPG72_019593, partial [Tetrahymena utriculariae]
MIFSSQMKSQILDENDNMIRNIDIEIYQYGNNSTHQNLNQEQIQPQFSSFAKAQEYDYDYFPPQFESDNDGLLFYSCEVTSNQYYSNSILCQNNAYQSTDENSSIKVTDYSPISSLESCQQFEISQQQSQQLDKNKKVKRNYTKIAQMLEQKIQNYLNESIENAHQDENYLRIKNWQASKKSITNQDYQYIYQNQSGLSVICYPNHTFETIAKNIHAQMIFSHFLQKTQDEIPFKFGEYMTNHQLKELFQDKLVLNIDRFNKICDFNKKLVSSLLSLKHDEQMIQQISYFIDNIQTNYEKPKQKKKQKIL